MVKKKIVGKRVVKKAAKRATHKKKRKMAILDEDGLSIKEGHFCEQYIIDNNGARAAEDAGFGNTHRSAAQFACQLLKHKRIQQRILDLCAARSARLQVTADDVLNEYGRIIRYDKRKLFNEDGSMKAIHELDEDTARVLQSVEVDEIVLGKGPNKITIGETKKVKAIPKQTALRDMAEHFGLIKSKVEIGADQTLREILETISGKTTGPPANRGTGARQES